MGLQESDDGVTKPPPSWKDFRRALLSLFTVWQCVIQDGDDDKYRLLSFHYWLDTCVSSLPEVNCESPHSHLPLPQACTLSWGSVPAFPVLWAGWALTTTAATLLPGSVTSPCLLQVASLLPLLLFSTKSQSLIYQNGNLVIPLLCSESSEASYVIQSKDEILKTTRASVLSSAQRKPWGSKESWKGTHGELKWQTMGVYLLSFPSASWKGIKLYLVIIMMYYWVCNTYSCAIYNNNVSNRRKRE